MELSSITSLLFSLETAMMIPHAAAAPLPALPFLAVHLYTLGLHLLRGELNLCSSAAPLRLPAAQFPSGGFHFCSRVCLCEGKQRQAIRIVNAPGK